MKYTLSILFFIVSFYSLGQNEFNLKQEVAKPFIEVTGTASKEIMPDKIFVTISLTNKIIDKQEYNIQEQEKKLKQILTENKIDLSLLTLSNSISQVVTKKEKEIGFEVFKIFMLELSSAEQVSKIFKELQDLNIKGASIEKVEHSKIDSLRKEVRIAAIKSAKNKAEYLLESIGEQLGKPMEIKEVVENSFFKENFLSNSNLLANQNETNIEDDKNELGFQKIKIKFSYFIKYSIK
jgi:uncharacterized protein YggE